MHPRASHLCPSDTTDRHQVSPISAALSSLINPLLEEHQSAKVQTLRYCQDLSFFVIWQVYRHGHELNLMS